MNRSGKFVFVDLFHYLFETTPLHPNPFTGGINVIPKDFPDSGRRRNSGNDFTSLTFDVCCTSKLNSPFNTNI